MKLKPLKEILLMTKDGIKAALAPVRAAKEKKRAELKQCEIDEKIASLESKIHELTAAEGDLDYDALIKTLDEIALLERRKKQFDQIIAELFPAK